MAVTVWCNWCGEIVEQRRYHTRDSLVGIHAQEDGSQETHCKECTPYMEAWEEGRHHELLGELQAAISKLKEDFAVQYATERIEWMRSMRGLPRHPNLEALTRKAA